MRPFSLAGSNNWYKSTVAEFHGSKLITVIMTCPAKDNTFPCTLVLNIDEPAKLGRSFLFAKAVAANTSKWVRDPGKFGHF